MRVDGVEVAGVGAASVGIDGGGLLVWGLL